MAWLHFFDVGRIKEPHQFKKFLLNDFIHPDLVKDMKIKVNPARMEIFYKGELILNFETDDWGMHYYKPEKYADNTAATPLDFDQFRRHFKKYYQQKHQESAKDKDYYFRILTLLDRRTGKRTLQKFVNEGDFFEIVVMNRDFRLEKLYKIRFDVAGIKYM